MKNFYAINLNRKFAGKSRWSLYEMTEHGLDVVWPKKPDKEGNARLELPNQVYSTLKQYPAYHFAVQGYGLSHIYEIAYDLANYFKEDVTVHELHGHSPSPHIAQYKERV